MKITNQIIEAPKWVLITLNNIYEIERKAKNEKTDHSILRNTSRINDILCENGFFYEDPMGQEFKETRTDLDATISGESIENLVVVEVIKPIIRFGSSALSKVVQKGIVIVESKK
jgi:hypothetical protein